MLAALEALPLVCVLLVRLGVAALLAVVAGNRH